MIGTEFGRGTRGIGIVFPPQPQRETSRMESISTGRLRSPQVGSKDESIYSISYLSSSHFSLSWILQCGGRRCRLNSFGIQRREEERDNTIYQRCEERPT